MRPATLPALGALLLTACSHSTSPAPTPQPTTSQPTSTSTKPTDWAAQEAPLLTNHIQLTSRNDFVKAGEAYFDHNSPPRWVIFQAVPVPVAGKDPEPFYSMYVARLTWKGEKLTGIEKAIKISPEGSANTCGWFNPVAGEQVVFGSTLTKPGQTQRPGFQVGTRKYIWMFPHEMEVVTRTIPEIFDALHPSAPHPTWGPDASTAKPLFSLPNYDAECSYSKNGRFVLYAHVRDEPTRGKDDADIWVYDTQTGQQHELVHADGYDGGPFWSPDNRRICYRSDRNGDDLLQLFVADLKFEGHTPVGISREYQVTNNGHVNWAPFWHPSGAFLVYGTSEVGHDNYEIFAAEAPPVGFDGFEHTEVAPGRTVDEPMTLGTRRITYASGADVLPVFSDDGKYMMWTAQRGPMVDGESKPSSQVWVAQFTIPPLSFKHEVFFLPRFDPPKSEDDARKIGLKVMEMRSSKRPFVGAERYENGWVVRFEDDCVDCRTNIYIHPNGTILRIGW